MQVLPEMSTLVPRLLRQANEGPHILAPPSFSQLGLVPITQASQEPCTSPAFVRVGPPPPCCEEGLSGQSCRFALYVRRRGAERKVLVTISAGPPRDPSVSYRFTALLFYPFAVLLFYCFTTPLLHQPHGDFPEPLARPAITKLQHRACQAAGSVRPPSSVLRPPVLFCPVLFCLFCSVCLSVCLFCLFWDSREDTREEQERW